MKQPALGFAVAAVAFAGSSLYLWTQLRQERAHAAQMEEATRQLNARVAELDKARAHFAQKITPGGGFGPAPPGGRPATQQSTPGMGSRMPLNQDEMTPEARAAMETLARVEISPAELKMMRAGNRAHIRRQYGEFAQQNGLSKELSSQLFDLLTDQQLAGLRDSPDFRNESDVRRYFEEKQRANEAAIADLIGADKAAQLKAYQESLPARMEFEMLAQQLDGSDAPLSAEQRAKLRALYVEERNRVPQPSYAAAVGPGYLDAYRAWSDDFDQRFRSQASQVLNAEQINAFTEIQQAQKEMRDQNGGFSAVSIPFGGAVQGDVVTFSTSGGNAAFISGAAVNVPAPAPAAPTKDP
jgi:hypothetical protein